MQASRLSHTSAIASIALLAALSLLAAGCQSSSQATAEAPAKPAADSAKPAADAKQPAAATPAKPAAKKGDAIFSVSDAVSEIKVGADGKATLKITPKAGFKINTEYPWKAALTAPEGITLKSAAFGKDTWSLDNKAASLEIPVQASAAGEKTIEGKLNFSICDDSRCEVFRDEAVKIKVAAR